MKNVEQLSEKLASLTKRMRHSRHKLTFLMQECCKTIRHKPGCCFSDELKVFLNSGYLSLDDRNTSVRFFE